MFKNRRGKTVFSVMAAALLVLSASVGAGEVTIVNPGFEDPVQAEDAWTYDYPGWGEFNNVDGQSLGTWNPGSGAFGSVAPEGENVGWVSGATEDVGFAQVLTETLTVGMVYTLTVQVGDSPYYEFAGYKVQLLAGGSTDDNAGEVTVGTLLAEDDSSVTIADDTFGLSTVVYTYDPADAALLGQNLQIRLIAVPGSGEVDFDDVRLDAFLDLNPSPANNAIVDPAGNLELSWSNLDPNTPGDPVFVDVWFGTDPNKLDSLHYTKVVPAGENTTSVIVDASLEGTYYWQVDSHIYGADHINDANMIKGSVYTFEAASDFPPSVVQIDTSDMITWSGQEIQLDTTVADDGMSQLSYAWSAYPADGVVFTPDDGGDGSTSSVEEPTVMISKEPGIVKIPIVNAGFENPEYADGESAYSLGSGGWSEGNYLASNRNAWLIEAWSAGIYNPSAAQGYGGNTAEGENAGFQESYNAYDMGIRQILAANLMPDAHYELSVKVGNPAIINGGVTSDYRVELVAGGVIVASSAGASPVDDTWTDVTVTYDSPSTVSEGQALEIRLVLVDNGSTGTELDFDDVKLNITGTNIPATVTLTFGVRDEANPTPVEDTITIDVYDDACVAARIGVGLAADNPGDIDGNCITDLKDIAAMAQTWLDDTGLTESVLAPASGGGQ